MATITFSYRSEKETAPLEVRLSFRIKGRNLNPEGKENPYSFYGRSQIEVTKTYWREIHNKTEFPNHRDVKKQNQVEEIKQKQITIRKKIKALSEYILNSFSLIESECIDKEDAEIKKRLKTWLKIQIETFYQPVEKDNSIPLDLVSYIDFYIDYRKNELKEPSIKKYKVIKNKLLRFEKHRKSTILIKNVNDQFKNDFVTYLKNEKYAQNTMQREMVFIKSFCKHARFMGLETHPQLDSLRLERAKVSNIYLSILEIEKIEKAEDLLPHLQNVRDWLIISCYLGQRISDFMRFTAEMIRYESGEALLEFTQKKTGKLMTIPVHPKVIKILEKRNGEFPEPISHQKYNDYIKIVCQKAKINCKVKGSKKLETEPKSKKFRKSSGTFEKWELVSSHIGRRSFATNFYGKMPTSYLIHITGHSSENLFLEYIQKSNKDLALEISKYF
tara:strand:- start:4676 stop:6010 length:1335 start_codon:yes stop_codon:yes gene_type:complete